MNLSRALLGLVCLTACGTAPVSAWWWNDGSSTYRSYSTTTFTVRPYNAFSDMSISMSTNGSLPISLLGGCGNNNCNNNCCVPQGGHPPCYGGWPTLYYNYGGCNVCSYPPAMYYPTASYYPPLPPQPMPKGQYR